MHILVQPIGEGYKQGLSHQVSLTKALACDGFERSEKKGDRLSMTRWQDDIKDNIMEPILKRHKYTRAYKDGEKQHLPVALYKRAMEEKDAIVEQAKEEKTAEVASIENKYSKMWDDYEALREGYKDKDGRHILGYNELVQRHKELLQDPARLLET